MSFATFHLYAQLPNYILKTALRSRRSLSNNKTQRNPNAAKLRLHSKMQVEWGYAPRSPSIHVPLRLPHPSRPSRIDDSIRFPQSTNLIGQR